MSKVGMDHIWSGGIPAAVLYRYAGMPRFGNVQPGGCSSYGQSGTAILVEEVVPSE